MLDVPATASVAAAPAGIDFKTPLRLIVFFMLVILIVPFYDTVMHCLALSFAFLRCSGKLCLHIEPIGPVTQPEMLENKIMVIKGLL